MASQGGERFRRLRDCHRRAHHGFGLQGNGVCAVLATLITEGATPIFLPGASSSRVGRLPVAVSREVVVRVARSEEPWSGNSS